MEITYLKLEHKDEILSVCKIVDKKQTLTAHKNDISIYNEDMNKLKLDGGFKLATKAEFDNFYISTVKKINQISSL